MTGVRGFNPIWFEVDLQAHAFDDNFWFYVLENTIPYIPETVYHDADLTIPWTNPIRFLANGTLPIDIFFDPSKVYRLEFRQNLGLAPPSQADPLIYEVNDYVPSGGGVVPTPTVSLTSENETTNGQFSIINFASPLTITVAGTYEIAPGWNLTLGGTGSAVITRVPLNSTNVNSSNAPYALHLVLSGWTADSVILKQRFQQNGILWSGKYVASTVTARTGVGFQSLTANLVNSNSTMSVNVLSVPIVSGTFTEYRGHGLVPASANTDVPPAAWIEYQLLLASTNDIYLTSFQLTVGDTIAEPTYVQDTVDRQIDHTYHYYNDSLVRQQKESVLTGWDFGLNPWQFHPTTQTNTATNTYTADQTIVIQQNYVANNVGNNVFTLRDSAANNHQFRVGAVTATNQFALIQYVDPTTFRAGWGKNFSSMVKLSTNVISNTVGIRMKLIYRTTLPASISRTEPVASWAANGDPVMAAGWTQISSKNDPLYLLQNGSNTLLFESFNVPAASTDDMTIGIMIYTTASMLTVVPDAIGFRSISLVQNDFAIETQSLTFDETLRRCQYYYTKSFRVTEIPTTGAGTNTGESYITQANAAGTANTWGPIIRFSSAMRATPTITLYNPVNNNSEIYNEDRATDWAATAVIAVNPLSFTMTGTPPGGSVVGDLAGIHWTAKAFLGL